MSDIFDCLVLYQSVNTPIFALKLLALQPHVHEYSRQHVEHLEALELSDWDALQVV